MANKALTNGKYYKFSTLNNNSTPTITFSEDFLDGISARGTVAVDGTITTTGNINGAGTSDLNSFDIVDCNWLTYADSGTTAIKFAGVASAYIDWILSGNTRMRLENDGDLQVEGDVIAYSSATSDIRLKKNIRPISSSLETICKLDGIKFDWKYRDEKDQIGLIAQEVEKHIPEVIKEHTLPFYASSSIEINDDGIEEFVSSQKLYKTINYDMLIPHLIESVKELKSEVDELKIKLGNK
jgi:hypothetical protein